MQDGSLLARSLWTLVLVGVVVAVVVSFARNPLAGGDDQVGGLGQPVTLWVANGETGGVAEAVAQQAAGCWQSDGLPARVGTLSGGSAGAVVSFLTRVHGAPDELLVITSTTLSDIAHDLGGSLPPEPHERALQALRLLAGAAPIAVLGSEPLMLAVRAGSPIRTRAELLSLMRRQPARTPPFGVAGDTLLQDNLAALVRSSGLHGELPYALFGSTREALVSLEAGEVEVVLAPAGALREGVRRGRLRELSWPVPGGGAPRAWVAIVAPIGLSPRVVADLRTRARTLCTGSAWTRLLREDGRSPVAPATRRLAGFVRAEVGAARRLQALAAQVVRGN
jgi:hypothetical protein